MRLGLRSGTAHLASEDCVGEGVHKTTRIATAGLGGQALVSKETCQLARLEVTDLGEHRLKDFE